MKRLPLLALAVSVALLLAIALPAAATSNPFRGNWKGTDLFDGSNITYQIVEVARTGGKVFEIRGRDDVTGDWCGGRPATMKAVGVLESEDYMVLSLVWSCLSPDHEVTYFHWDSFTYDPASDTFIDSGGAVFHRQR